MWKSTISEKVLIRFLNCFNIFALCEQFWKIWILGPLLRQKGSPCCQNLGPLKKSCKSVYVARCKVEFRVLILSLECFRSYVKRTMEGVLTSRHFQIFLFQSPTHLNPQQPATLGTLRVKVRLHFQIFLFQSPTHLNPLWGPQQPATLGTLRVNVRLHFQIFLFTTCRSPPQPLTIFQNTLMTPWQALCGPHFSTSQLSLKMAHGSVHCALTAHLG